MPLSMLTPGQRARVTDVRGGHGLRRRLASMGIVNVAEVAMVGGGGSGGPVIISIGESRFGIGRGMAHHVIVEPLD